MNNLRVSFLILFATGVFVATGLGQFQKTNLPPALKVQIPIQRVWQSMQETLKEDLGLVVAREDIPRGEIVTEYFEYISGPLTREHIAKIGDRPKLVGAEWVKAHYRYEVRLVVLTGDSTLVEANTRVQGLKREFLERKEEWVDIRSTGRLESDLLTAFGQRAFGSEFTLTRPRKGFWDFGPQRVPDPMERIPDIARPERPPQ